MTIESDARKSVGTLVENQLFHLIERLQRFRWASIPRSFLRGDADRVLGRGNGREIPWHKQPAIWPSNRALHVNLGSNLNYSFLAMLEKLGMSEE